MTLEEIGRYDPYTDKFLKNTTFDRVEIGTDGNLYRLSISNGNEFLPIDRLYTKADMVAMLDELKEQLREMHEDFFESEHFDEAYGVSDSMDLIQQKINALNSKCEGCEYHMNKPCEVCKSCINGDRYQRKQYTKGG